MSGKYILEGKTPVPFADVTEWAEWFEKADRQVARTEIDDVLVSTVFTGLDLSFGSPVPLVFETMVFGGEHDQDCERYSTWEQAEAGHKEMVAKIRGEIS